MCLHVPIGVTIREGGGAVRGKKLYTGTYATGYWLEGPGIASRWGETFSTCLDRHWGPPSRLYNGYSISFLGVKRPGRGVNHPPTSSVEVKERVELYLYSPSGPAWSVPVRNLAYR